MMRQGPICLVDAAFLSTMSGMLWPESPPMALSALVPANMSGTKQRQKDARLCGLQNADHRDGAAENVQSAVIGGDGRVMTRTGM
jgi:hypothetical protein